MVFSEDLYANSDARVDTLGTFTSADINFWKCVRASKKFYDHEVCHGYYEPTVAKFVKWLVNEYGIELQMTEDGQINTMYRIVDDAKLTMFTLKFTQ